MRQFRGILVCSSFVFSLSVLAAPDAAQPSVVVKPVEETEQIADRPEPVAREVMEGARVMPLPDVANGKHADPATANAPVSFDLRTHKATILAPSAATDRRAAGGNRGMLRRPKAEAQSPFRTDSFNTLTQVGDPSAYPWRVNVKVFMTFRDTTGTPWNYVCSGTLLDPRHVLTAGHCVFAHTDSSIGRTFNDWAESITVVPGYQNGFAPYGTANAIDMLSWIGWTSSEDFDYDQGVISLDRPVGAITGWNGFNYSDSCDFFTGTTFTNPGYPAESPYNGETLWTWSGNFDACTYSLGFWYGDEITIYNRAYHGQSGSGISDANKYLFATLSNGYSNVTNDVRITSSRFNDILSFNDSHRSATPDLIPLHTAAVPSTIGAGSRFSSFQFLVHDNSLAPLTADVACEVYLSTNNIISTLDTYLTSVTAHLVFTGRDAYVVQFPAGFAPVIPANTPPGTYYVGVRLNYTDADSSNNTTVGWDSQAITVGATSDATPPSVSITYPSVSSFSTGTSPVILGGYSSDNVGVLDVRWSSNRGGSGTASGTNPWSASIPLQSGANVLTLTARDVAGNSSSTSLTVTLTSTTTLGDFNADGHADIVLRSYANGANAVWLMNGASLLNILNLPALPNTSYHIDGTGDFNSDGKPDVFWRNYATGANAVWLMNGASLLSVVDLPALPNTSYHVEATTDFNGDGKADILWRNYSTGANALWLMNGTSFTGIVDLPALPNTLYHAEGAGDFNADGKPDIVWRNYSTGANALWLMNGTSFTGIVDLPALPNTSYRIEAVTDLNGDGKSDVIWRNYATGANASWLMNGTAFSSILDLPALPNTSYEINGPR